MWVFVRDDEHLLEEMRELKPVSYALDIETTGLDPFTDEILLIQVGREDGRVVILDARKLSDYLITEYLEHLFNAMADTVILHNAKFDIKMLMYHYGAVPRKGVLYDTELAEILMYNGLISPYVSLKQLLKKYLAVDVDKEIREEFIGYDKEDFSNELLEYAAGDVLHLFEICSAQQYFLNKNDLQRVARLEFDLITPVSDMELKGVYLDTNKWLDLYRETLEEQHRLEEELVEMAREVVVDWKHPKTGKVYHYDFSEKPINLNSPFQLMGAFKYFGHDLKSSNAATVSTVRHLPFAEKLLEHKKLAKRTSTYGDTFLEHVHPVTGRVHSSFNQLGAASGRFSSDRPNLQNIPARDTKAYRNCFVNPPGRMLITADYSQIELRLAGEFSQDEKFINAYKNGEDLHQLTADIIERERQDGKTLNFTILYGASGFRVSREFGVSKEEGDEIIKRWKSGFDKLNVFITKVENFVEEHGYSLTATGRRRYFDMPDTRDKRGWVKMNEIKREAVNHPIQGTSADMIKIAITNLFYRLRDHDAYVVLTVHDEIMIECAEEYVEIIKKIVEDEMIKAAEVFLKIIPAKVDVKSGEVWGH